MILFLKVIRGTLFAVVAGCLAAPQASAALISLEQFEFQTQPGTETSLNPLAVATGLTGGVFTESSGLTAVTGLNSMNSSGWNDLTQYYQVGFTVNAGFTASVSQITMTSRSSATGPGLINVMASVDGGAFISVGSITQLSTAYNDEMLAINPVTAAHSLVIRFMAANTVSASGGTVGSGGTFRIGDYNPNGALAAPPPFTLSGSVVPSAVSEPASVALMTLGLVVAAGVARVRSRVSIS